MLRATHSKYSTMHSHITGDSRYICYTKIVNNKLQRTYYYSVPMVPHTDDPINFTFHEGLKALQSQISQNHRGFRIFKNHISLEIVTLSEYSRIKEA